MMKTSAKIYFIFVIHLTFSVILQPKGPTYKKYAIKCINGIISDAVEFVKKKYVYYPQFVLTHVKTMELGSPGYEIQEEVLTNIRNKKVWSVEVFSNERLDFEAYEENCDCSLNNPENFLGVFRHPQGCIRKHYLSYKTHLYTMIFEDFAEFEEKLELLTTSPNLNREALILIYFTEFTRNNSYMAFRIIQKVFGYSITKSIVIIPKDLLTFEIYDLKIYDRPGKTCYSEREVKLSYQCVRGNIIKSDTKTLVFNENTQSSFNNCILHVHARQYEPFVINETWGFEIGILRVIGNALNVTFDIKMSKGHESRSLGKRNENGTWTGFIEPLYNHWSLGIGNIVPEYDYTQDFIYSIGYYSEDLVWVVPKAALIPRWRVLMAIFSLEMWGVILAVIFSFSIFFYMSKTKKEVSCFKTFERCYAAAFEILIGVPVSIQPVTHFTRIFFIALAIFGIIINSVYTSSLVYYLQNPIREYQVSEGRDILHSGMIVGGSLKMRSIFEDSPNPLVKQLVETFQTVNESIDSYKYWLKLVSTKKNLATISIGITVKYLISKNSPLVTDSHGEPKVQISTDPVITQNVGIMMRRGAFQEKCINSILQRLIIEAGIGSKLKNEILRFGTSDSSFNMQNSTEDISDDDDDESVTVLTVYHLEGAFAILALGYSSAFLIFLMEIIYFYVKEQVKKYKR